MRFRDGTAAAAAAAAAAGGDSVDERGGRGLMRCWRGVAWRLWPGDTSVSAGDTSVSVLPRCWRGVP